MKLKRLFSEAITLAAFALIGWLTISWVDVLMHNDPITGDAAYWRGNVIVMMTELREEETWQK